MSKEEILNKIINSQVGKAGRDYSIKVGKSEVSEYKNVKLGDMVQCIDMDFIVGRVLSFHRGRDNQMYIDYSESPENWQYVGTGIFTEFVKIEGL